MQAINNDASIDTSSSAEPPSSAPSQSQPTAQQYQWLGHNHNSYNHRSNQAYWQWQVGTALTGTAAAISAGLALPFATEQAVNPPATEALLPPEQTSTEAQHSGSRLTSQANQIALDQAEGLSPQIRQANQAVFSRGSDMRANRHSAIPSAIESALETEDTAPAATVNGAKAQRPLITHKADGSWTLAYDTLAQTRQTQTSQRANHSDLVEQKPSVAIAALNTQTIVSQLAREAADRAESVCLNNSCRSLSYIQAQLPKAKQDVQTIQQQIDAFEARHAQNDITSYQTVLTDRINEITTQGTEVAFDLTQTQRDISQIQAKLSIIGVEAEWAEHLLALDTEYQNDWYQLQQIERQLLEEFSKANLDSTELNRIYEQYERQQIALDDAAQAVLSNYLTTQPAEFLAETPAALELLQALTMSSHQRNVQTLRQTTVDEVKQRLEHRHQSLAASITEYESLQRELRTAQSLVSQYETEQGRIATEAISALPRFASQTSQPSAALNTAQTLEAQAPEGSLAKTILGIVVAAGAVAVAVQRRNGKLSEALSLEIVPNARSRFGFPAPTPAVAPEATVTAATQRLAPAAAVPDLLTELLDITEPEQPVLAAIESESQRLTPTFSPASEVSFAIEALSRELGTVLEQAKPESQFASEVRDRIEKAKMEPVRLPLAQIDAFAESAIRWVLKDLSTHPSTVKVKTA